MDAFAECEEQKERVKACYGDWFQKLWGGSFDRSNCDQETQDYRQCVQDAMQRRKDQAKRKVDTDWMDGVKEKADEVADDAKTRARNARQRAQKEKEGMKDKASDVTSKMQETADSVAGKIKGFAKKADKKVRGED